MFILEKQEHEVYAKKKEKKSQNFTTQRKLSTVTYIFVILNVF